MKKTFAVIAAVLFVLSFAASAFAIHAEIPAETQAIVAKGSTQLTLGGEIRIRGWYYDNLGRQNGAAVNGIPQESNSKANYDQRVRLSLDAAVAPGVTGRVMLETGNSDALTTDVYAWGRLNSKPNGTTTFNEAWIQYAGTGLFGFNAGIKAGHMPLKLGEGVFFDNTQYGDDAIVFFMDPTKELHIGLLTIKASEGSVRAGGLGGNNTNSNDLDAYVGLFTYKIAPTHSLGMNYTYINQSDVSLSFQNVGLHGNGTVGNFGYKFEADFQFGSIGEGNAEADFGGWGVALAANYKMDKLNLRGMFAYGSGDDKADGDIDEFQTLVGGIQHYTFVYDYRAGTAATDAALSGASGRTGTGIANTTVYALGLDYDWNKQFKSKFDAYYLRASESRNGGDKDIGIELDAQLSYQLAKNLNYQINAGILFTGDFYKDLYGVSSKNATVLQNMLTLSF